jgi:hypothetical protein
VNQASSEALVERVVDRFEIKIVRCLISRGSDNLFNKVLEVVSVYVEYDEYNVMNVKTDTKYAQTAWTQSNGDPSFTFEIDTEVKEVAATS